MRNEDYTKKNYRKKDTKQVLRSAMPITKNHLTQHCAIYPVIRRVLKFREKTTK